MAFPLTASEFKLRFKAFADLDDDIIEPKLDEAEREISETVWGELAENGHGFLTAHKLTLSGYGKIVSKDSTTNFGTEYERLQETVGGTYRFVPE